ncbi:hypothetical protein AC244_26910 [Ensifer adhaerens]|uniref:Transmembrane protein n=1 Tax=Ensifer adhaerens TaxID=106592 RepID=A0A0L8BIE3_ENSAD|nr:hypothetical protein [Ensifer adhaerens]KOF14476.1 hypothetical protein AC244_26910 [Ensifer adhaerens]
MTFGPSRPPLTEDVAEVIVRDIKQAEGHGATSEVPMPFLKSLYRLPLMPSPIRKSHACLMFGVAAIGLVAILLLSGLLTV